MTERWEKEEQAELKKARKPLRQVILEEETQRELQEWKKKMGPEKWWREEELLDDPD